MLQFKHKKNEKNVQIVQREVRMKKLLYRPKDAWVGDLIPYYENGTFYGYYLHDPKDNGITPISVDGVDRWPVQRYLAMLPFRETGNDFIINLRDGKEKMDSETGREAAEFMKEMGQYFNDGFAATDYATAQSMFLDGKSAMYYIGDWEIGAMQDAYEQGKIDYFYLPTTEGAKTQPNEFCINSGIGMAFNAETFDEKTKDFILLNKWVTAGMTMGATKG